jgi:REP element-mobilizing transposase RayT
MRHRGHDYRAPCTVHVTICTHHHQPLFGAIDRRGLHLNDAGRFVAAALAALHSDAGGIAIDTSIVMPDHVHAIIALGTNPAVATTASIPSVVEAFKMRVFKSWPAGIRRGGWAPYDTHLWQRSYYDTLIRTDAHLQTTRAYILANPDRWIARLGVQEP